MFSALGLNRRRTRSSGRAACGSVIVVRLTFPGMPRASRVRPSTVPPCSGPPRCPHGGIAARPCAPVDRVVFDQCCSRTSATIRTARSRSSAGHFLEPAMTPSFTRDEVSGLTGAVQPVVKNGSGALTMCNKLGDSNASAKMELLQRLSVSLEQHSRQSSLSAAVQHLNVWHSVRYLFHILGTLNVMRSTCYVPRSRQRT